MANTLEKIRLSSFNCRGLRNALKRNKIFNWLKQDYYGISLLHETHSCPSDLKKWKSEWDGEIYFSHGESNAKGVAILSLLLYCVNVKMTILNNIKQIVLLTILLLKYMYNVSVNFLFSVEAFVFGMSVVCLSVKVLSYCIVWMILIVYIILGCYTGCPFLNCQENHVFNTVCRKLLWQSNLFSYLLMFTVSHLFLVISSLKIFFLIGIVNFFTPFSKSWRTI